MKTTLILKLVCNSILIINENDSYLVICFYRKFHFVGIISSFDLDLCFCSGHAISNISVAFYLLLIDESIFVHFDNGPSYVSITPVLTGLNYHSCVRSMWRAFGAKMKFELLDGTILMPIDSFDLLFCVRNRCNMLIHSWIMKLVDALHNISCSSWMFDSIWRNMWFNPRCLWTLVGNLRAQARFMNSNRIFLYTSNSMEELDIYMSIPTCTCRVESDCEAMRATRCNHQLLHFMRFLIGLNENFRVVKS